MGEYNGGTRKRLPSLTQRMENIRAEHIERCIAALGGFARHEHYGNPCCVCGSTGPDDPRHWHTEPASDHVQHTIRFYIRSAVAATELAVNEDNRTRETQKAQAKQESLKKLFHRPGRFGHG